MIFGAVGLSIGLYFFVFQFRSRGFALPAAVINFILTEKFGQDPDLAASIVVLSTLLSVVTVPMLFWLIL